MKKCIFNVYLITYLSVVCYDDQFNVFSAALGLSLVLRERKEKWEVNESGKTESNIFGEKQIEIKNK